MNADEICVQSAPIYVQLTNLHPFGLFPVTLGRKLLINTQSLWMNNFWTMI